MTEGHSMLTVNTLERITSDHRDICVNGYQETRHSLHNILDPKAMSLKASHQVRSANAFKTYKNLITYHIPSSDILHKMQRYYDAKNKVKA